jgi:multiple sugar transport system substrate-binding protein
VKQSDAPSEEFSFGPTNRREFMLAGGSTVAAVALFGLAACGGDDAGAKGPVVVAVSPDMVDMMKPKLREYSRRSGQEVKLRVMPADTGQYFDRIRTQLEAGSPDVDVIAGDVSWPAQFGANGWLLDLNEKFPPAERKKYLPATIAANTYKGKIYGIPFFTDTGLLWYRKDLLAKSGISRPPATWAELREMAIQVKKASGVKNGYVFTGADYEGGVVLGLEYIRTSGGDVLDGDKVVVASPAAVRGLEIERSMVESGASPEAVANFKEDETGGAFLAGQAVFMRNWPYMFGLIADKKESDIKPDQVGVAQVPVAAGGIPRVNVGGGWNFFINAASERQDAALAVAQFLSAPAQQRTWAVEASYLPTRTKLYSNRTIIDTLPAVARGKQAIFDTTTPPVSPYYSDLSRAMAKQFNASLSGSVSPQGAANALQGELEGIVSRGG